MRPSDLADELKRRLLASDGGGLPTSTLGRFGRTAWAALSHRRLLGGAPADVESLAALVGSLGQLKGIAMKVGQMMSFVEVALPDDVRGALAALQTSSPPMPFERVREIVTADLGPRAAPLLAQMDPRPAAAASIGQVHRATLPDGTRVAVKVRYPDIDRAIESDFRPAAIGTQLAGLFVPGADVTGLVREARERFLAECDYEKEADSQARFARIYAGHPLLAVPAVERAYSGARVLTTHWADGVGFDSFLDGDPSQEERDRVGAALFEFYVGTLYRHGLYNCDPHPGNYVFAPGRLVMLDYGCTRAFEPAFVRGLAALTAALHDDDPAALRRALLAVGLMDEKHAHDLDTVRGLLRAFYGPMLKDEELVIAPGEARNARELLESKRELLKLRLPGEFLFLFRIRFGLLSLLGRLGARANWYRMERGFAAGEAPESLTANDNSSD